MSINKYLFLLLLPLSVLGQDKTFTIKGTVKNYFPGQKVYLVPMGGWYRTIDSATIKDGSFVFTGPVSGNNEPEENYQNYATNLFLGHNAEGFYSYSIPLHSKVTGGVNDSHTVYREAGITEVFITDSVRKAVIKPPAKNQGHYTLDSIYTSFFTQQNKWLSRLLADKTIAPNKRMDSINRHTAMLNAEMETAKWKFIKDHPSSPVSLYLLKHDLDKDYYPDYNKIAPYYDGLSVEMKATEFGQAYGVKLAGMKNTRIGAPAPDFKMDNPKGKSVKLSSLKGKYVLVDFWASWCGPCRQENPNVVAAYEKFKDKNFVILGVSLDQDHDAWTAAIEKDHLDWQQVSDLKYWNSEAAHLYSVTAIPQNFLLDPNGKIIAKNLFGSALTWKLASLFRGE